MMNEGYKLLVIFTSYNIYKIFNSCILPQSFTNLQGLNLNILNIFVDYFLFAVTKRFFQDLNVGL